MKGKVHIIITKQVHKKMDTWLTKINLNNILTVTRAISTTILFMYWLRLSTTPSTVHAWTQIQVWSSMNWFLRPGRYMYMQDSVRSMCCYFSTERRHRNIKSGLVPPHRPAFPKPHLWHPGALYYRNNIAHPSDAILYSPFLLVSSNSGMHIHYSHSTYPTDRDQSPLYWTESVSTLLS